MTSSEARYRLEQLDAELWCVSLPSARVFVAGAREIALINAGPATAARALRAALREAGLDPGRVARIVATSWRPDVIGGASAWPGVPLFAWDPELRGTGPIRQSWERARREWEGFAAALGSDPSSFFDDHFAGAPGEDAPLIGLDSGVRVALGPLDCVAHRAPGLDPGGLVLFEPERRLLFGGELGFSELPPLLDDAAGYLEALERVAALEPALTLPNRARPDPYAPAGLVRAARFLENFLSAAPRLLEGRTTLRSILEADRGLDAAEAPIEFAALLITYRALFDALAADGSILSGGEGLERWYAPREGGEGAR